MHADLARRLETAFKSPYSQVAFQLMPDLRSKIIDDCVEAFTFEKLPQETKDFIKNSDDSVELAKKMYPESTDTTLTARQKLNIFEKINYDL